MANSIKEAFQTMGGGDVMLYQGTVTSADPLKIQIEGDDKLVISEANTVVPWHMTDYETLADITMGEKTSVDYETEEAEAHTHKITDVNITKAKIKVYNSLQEGDKVYVLSLLHGKRYFVLDRIEGEVVD